VELPLDRESKCTASAQKLAIRESTAQHFVDPAARPGFARCGRVRGCPEPVEGLRVLGGEWWRSPDEPTVRGVLHAARRSVAPRSSGAWSGFWMTIVGALRVADLTVPISQRCNRPTGARSWRAGFRDYARHRNDRVYG